jgi:hypothetical protein
VLVDLNLHLIAVKSESLSMESGASTEKTSFEYGGLSTMP